MNDPFQKNPFDQNLQELEYIREVTKWNIVIESNGSGEWYCAAYFEDDSIRPFFRGDDSFSINVAIDNFLAGLKKRQS